ncbi:tetratricopeptide repeat protein [Pseudoalteromonas sp. SR44-5]|uniref:tetratricopeptide repeat protein n=1 Tax=Pseudoalteromonas sp. SR44-5 TaxID=2760934 RepID=UPI0016042F3A|nr:tetratricopeptide repeat protein [Pseudoalteromonas sp. SR44-5]MBB1369081.1 tetratricopeptide repeat protein [Pseudoalteromonas sp. SR44-5]
MNIKELEELYNKAAYYHESNELKKAAKVYEQVISLLPNISVQILLYLSPKNVDPINLIAVAYLRLAKILHKNGLEEAKSKYENAITSMEGVRTWFNRNELSWPISNRNNLADAYTGLANLLVDKGELKEAKGHFQEGINLDEMVRTWHEEHNKEWPISYRNNLASSYMNFALLLAHTGELELSKKQYEEAIAIQKKLDYGV